MKIILSLEQLKEKYQEMRKNPHIDFIDLQKAYNKVPRDLVNFG